MPVNAVFTIMNSSVECQYAGKWQLGQSDLVRLMQMATYGWWLHHALTFETVIYKEQILLRIWSAETSPTKNGGFTVVQASAQESPAEATTRWRHFRKFKRFLHWLATFSKESNCTERLRVYINTNSLRGWNQKPSFSHCLQSCRALLNWYHVTAPESISKEQPAHAPKQKNKLAPNWSHSQGWDFCLSNDNSAWRQCNSDSHLVPSLSSMECKVVSM